MAELKTKETSEDIGTFLDGIEGEQRRADSRKLIEIMSRITGKKPKLWGNIVGFGNYHYRYASGHEGDAALTGFSPRKPAFSIYLACYFPEQAKAAAPLFARLGKHKMGKSCLYVKTLDDIDLSVLTQLIEMSVEGLRRHYPEQS